MAKLILGPLLRRVTGNQAVIWLQTDSDAEVTLMAGEVQTTVRTKEIHGIHLALPILSDLPEGRTPYEVHLDGEQVWPLPEFPASTIPVSTDEETRIAFGSCREPLKHGTDALAAYAERALDHKQKQEQLPDLLALIGDQIYADIPHRPRVTTFEDYVALYHEAWSAPAVRWLLSTVPTIMIFDDHEIIDDWNSSARWLADIKKRPWWKSRVSAGLTSYHLFQHLGNLTPAELTQTDWSKPPQRWGYTVDIGRTRLIVLDCRGSRVLTGKRRMFPQDEWDRLAQDSQADCDHLLIAGSLPWLLAPAIDLAEHVVEQLSERHGGRIEKFRRKYDLEHWAAVGDSFIELAEVIKAVQKPSTVSVLGGDVHHSYVVQALFPSTPKVHQITCSPLNNRVSWVMRAMLKTAWATPFPHGLVKRRKLMKPFFGNAIAILVHRDRDAIVSFESPDPVGQLKTIFTRQLT